jgi:hypothetical protein
VAFTDRLVPAVREATAGRLAGVALVGPPSSFPDTTLAAAAGATLGPVADLASGAVLDAAVALGVFV